MGRSAPGASTAGEGLIDRFRPSGFFVLRSTLLPTAAFREWRERVVAPSSEAVSVIEEPDRDEAQLRREMERALSSPAVRDALRVASPGLDDARSADRGNRPARKRARLDRTLVQYFARMSDRCTPFGLFAGVSLGEVGGETRLRLAGVAGCRRRSTLDLGQVAALAESLRSDPEVRREARYRVNDTVVIVPGGYQYVESRQSGGAVHHEAQFVDATPALDTALRRAESGATPAELAEAVAAVAGDVAAEEIARFVEELIETQVLLPDWMPAVVGDDPLDQMLDLLPASGASRVRPLREAIRNLDDSGVGAPKSAWDGVGAVWTNGLGMKASEQLLQVDLFRESPGLRLDETVVEEALRAAEPLRRLAGAAGDGLRELKNRFRERYESREVPLTEAFDPERGIGLPGSDLRPRQPAAPLVAGLDIGAGRGRDGGGAPRSGFADAMWERLQAGALDAGGALPPTLELDDELLARVAPTESAELPDAASLQFEIWAGSEAAVRRGDYRLFIRGLAGPSGARMLGRFCDLDAGLEERVREHLREEEALEPEVVFAEVVHTPEGRVGNVVRRPHLREVELSCAGNSRFRGDARLTAGDLLLRLEGGRFRLRSRKDGREVRPRLTSAHNFRRSQGLYRFLCALQGEGCREGFGWGWGSLNGLPYLPRVVRGRAVYSLARWQVGRGSKAFERIGKGKSAADRERAVGELVEEVGLPRWARLVEGDNRLLLDLGNPLCRKVLADYARRRPSLVLEEVLTEDLVGCVESPEGRHRHEIILPLVRREPRKSSGESEVGEEERSRPVAATDSGASGFRRVFPPGDEWFFLKIYCATVSADHLLRQVVAPLAVLHRQREPDEPWFFIRYSDPENHLRARFRGDSETLGLLDARAAELLRPFFREGLAHRLAVDTYVREAERYGGGRGMELAERWFRLDSEAVLRVVEAVEGSGEEGLRWKAALVGFDRLLGDFGLALSERREVIAKARENFGREFSVGAPLRRQLAGRLRREMPGVLRLLAGAGEDAEGSSEGPLTVVEAAFRERSAGAAGIVREFREREEAGELERPLPAILRDFTHMHANRLLRVAARKHELVIHDFRSPRDRYPESVLDPSCSAPGSCPRARRRWRRGGCVSGGRQRWRRPSSTKREVRSCAARTGNTAPGTACR